MSKLTEIADVQRNQMITFNSYKDSNGENYGAGHPNAISDGDAKGKGDPNETGNAGSKADVEARNQNITSNLYKDASGQVYNAGHPNAVSDGDAKGKGDTGSGEAGGKADVEARKFNLTSNLYRDANGQTYNAGHPNAVSDGDEKGKGDPNGTGNAGSKADVEARAKNITSNLYREQNGQSYRAGHPNAVSDGDEKGKGENNGSVGGRTDVLTRNQNSSKNFYSEENQYTVPE